MFYGFVFLNVAQRQTVKKPHNLQTNIVFYFFFGAKNRIFIYATYPRDFSPSTTAY